MAASATGAGHAGRRSTLRLAPDVPGAVRPVAGAGLARGRFRASRLATGAIRLEPRTAGGILDTACELLAARFAPLFAVGFCLWVPVTVLARTAARVAAVGGPGVSWPQLLMSGCVDALCAGFACVLVAASIEGREVSARDAFLAVLLRLPGLVFLSLLLGVAKVLIVFCCVGVVPLWLLAVAPTVYVIERCNVLRAVGRSGSLTATGPAFARWAGYTLLAGVMTVPFMQLQADLDMLDLHERLRQALSLSESGLDLAVAALSAPYLAVGSAFLGVVQAVFYYDLLVRREGFDLARRLDELEPDGGGA